MRLGTLFGIVQGMGAEQQGVDAAPTTQAAAAVPELEQQIPPVMQQWTEIKSRDIPALNQQLKNANLPEIRLEANPESEESDE